MEKSYYFPEKLQRALNRVLEHSVTLSVAASGCGKSTAVNEYLLKGPARDYRKLYYTCLGESVNRAWKAICSRIESIDFQVGQYLSAIELPSIDNIGEIGMQLQYLSCQEPTILCVDNFQLFALPCKAQLVEAFSLHGCRNLNILFVTQPHDFKMIEASLAPFRVNALLSGFFYFSKEDIERYFLQAQIKLSPQQLEQVWQTTDGYAAALNLQMESFKEQGFFEDSSHVATLMERVLWHHLNSAQRECLLRLSVLDSFSMKQAILLCSDLVSGEELGFLFREMGFLRYDSFWQHYLFHHLLLEYLNQKFELLNQEKQSDILHRAAMVSAEKGDMLKAAELYNRCSDYEAVIRLEFDAEDRVELIRMDNGKLVERLISPSYRKLLLLNPELTLILTMELYVEGRIALFQRFLQETQKILLKGQGMYDEERMRRLQGEYALMESFFCFNDVEKMCECHRRAYELLGGPTKLYSLNTAWTFGIPSIVTMFFREPGKLQRELEAVTEGLPTYYLLADHNGAGAPSAMAGEAALLHGNFKESLGLYHQAFVEAEQMNQESICYCVYLGKARIAISGGDVAAYIHMLENMEDMAYCGKEAMSVFTVALCRAYLDSLLGKYEEIPEWFLQEDQIQKRALIFAIPFVHVISCRLHLQRLRKHSLSYVAYEDAILQYIAHAQALHMVLPEIHFWIFLAIGAQLGNQQLKAQEYLRGALQLAAPDMILFPFAEEFELLKELLMSLVLRRDHQNFAEKLMVLGNRYQKGKRKILSAMEVKSSVLSAREHEIAVLLKQRNSVKDIAARLQISPSTVSNTMQSIYSKLGVHSKRELYNRDDL